LWKLSVRENQSPSEELGIDLLSCGLFLRDFLPTMAC
jgi:hypothetical protein